MGCGSWTDSSFDNYTKSTRGVSAMCFADSDATAQEIYKADRLKDSLNPKNVMRECRDNEEHPNTFPVILALDVTGSMGGAAAQVAKKLNELMTELYSNENVRDIEFCIMGIGDFYYDKAPVQISQFESDIRIAEQLDEIYFEQGGGGNDYESYSAAWYMGVNHCDLDCWKRGKKGLIITLGDEFPNPYIPRHNRNSEDSFEDIIGDKIQADIETSDILTAAKEKFNIYHISIDDKETSYRWYKSRRMDGIDEKWTELLDKNYKISTLDNLIPTLSNIIINEYNNENNFTDTFVGVNVTEEGISW